MCERCEKCKHFVIEEFVVFDENGEPFTPHSTNPVSVITIGQNKPLRSGGRLCDLCPTLLEMMGLAKPVEMTGESLIEA